MFQCFGPLPAGISFIVSREKKFATEFELKSSNNFHDIFTFSPETHLISGERRLPHNRALYRREATQPFITSSAGISAVRHTKVIPFPELSEAVSAKHYKRILHA